MGLKEDRAKRARMGLGRQLSQSMDNLCVRRENAKTIDPAVVSRLSKSTDNLCVEREESYITSRNTMITTEQIGQLSESIGNSYDGKRKASNVPNIFSKMTNRLSKSVDNLFQNNHTENAKPKFLSKATQALGMKGLRNNRQKDAKRRHKSVVHLEDDTHDTDSDNDGTYINGSHQSLEFRLVGKDAEDFYGYKGEYNLNRLFYRLHYNITTLRPYIGSYKSTHFK